MMLYSLYPEAQKPTAVEETRAADTVVDDALGRYQALNVGTNASEERTAAVEAFTRPG